MPARRRDYAAEYRRRITRNLARGFTRAQARGHPRLGEAGVSGRSVVPIYDARLEFGVRALREGRSLRRTARSVHVSEERLRAYALHTGVVERRGNRLVVVDDDRLREISTYSRGAEHVVRLRGYAEAAKWGRYMSAVGHFLDTNDPIVLLPFENDALTDADGNEWPFEVRPNILYRITLTTQDPSQHLYRIIAVT